MAREARSHQVAALLLMAAFAGCVGAPESDPSAIETAVEASGEGAIGAGLGVNASVEDGLEAIPPQIVRQSDCAQFHTFYPYPAQEFAAFAPDGFTVVEMGGPGLTNIVMYVTVCKKGDFPADRQGGTNRTGAFSEMWIYLPVNVPSALKNNSVDLDFVPLIGYIDNKEALRFYKTWGLDGLVFEAQLSHSVVNDSPAGRVSSVRVNSPIDSYTKHMAVQRENGVTFPEFDYRIWSQREGKATGYVAYATAEAPSVGLGAVNFVYQGPPLVGAPPSFTGQAHEVEKIGGSLEFHPIMHA